MNITILGAGEVGEYLCQYFSKEGYNITLIDEEKEKLERIMNLNDILGIQGDGTDISILKEAGIDKTDIFIAVTFNDEVNIVSSLIAKKLGAKNTVARLRNPIYAKHEKMMREISNIDLIINPELESAKEIIRNLKFSNILEIDTFAKGLVSLVSLIIKEDGLLNGIQIDKIHEKINKDILIPIVVREGITYIPKGDFILRAKDIVYFLGENKALKESLDNVVQSKDNKNIMIVGGDIISYYLLEDLIKNHFYIKLIEKDKKKAEKLSYSFPKADIICADGTNPDILEEERISNFDAFISLIDIDEENIISSIFAQQMGIKKTFTKINRTRMLELVALKDIGTVITPKRLTSDIIVKFIRSHSISRSSKIEALHRLANDNVEAIEFELSDESSLLNIPIKELSLKENTIIVFIMRKNKYIIPFGDDSLQLGDKVLVITLDKNFSSIEDIIK